MRIVEIGTVGRKRAKDGVVVPAIIDRAGNVVLDGCVSLGADLFTVQDSRELHLANGPGRIKTSVKFQEAALSVAEGLLPVGIDGKYGFVDAGGQLVIPPKYDGVREFAEGLAPALIGERWGYIDRAGTWVWSIPESERREP